MWWSVDLGLSWQPVNSGVPLTRHHFQGGLVVDANQRIYLVGGSDSNSGTYIDSDSYSDDFGATCPKTAALSYVP